MNKKTSIKIGVIPAGGRGTRLGWLGNFLPKSLVPIGTKPILYYIIENLRSMGINRIYLLVNYKSHLIKQYLQDEPNFKKISFHFVHSQPNLGLSDVIGKIRQYIKEPFVVILGDDFTLGSQLNQFPLAGLAEGIIAQEIVVKEKNKKVISQTCEIYFDKTGRITKAIEKPKHPKSSYRGCGIYFFKPQVFSYIQKTVPSVQTGKKEITDTINLIAKERGAFACVINGINVNINAQEDLIQATKHLFANDKK